MQISNEIAETVRFFSLLFKASEQELRQIVADEIQDLQYEGKSIFTIEEVSAVLGKTELQMKSLFASESDKVSKLVGSLCLQLSAQADGQGATIVPKPTELEDEKIIKLFKAGQKAQDSGMNRIQDTTLLNNEARIAELQQQLEQKTAEVARMEKLLEARVDQTP